MILKSENEGALNASIEKTNRHSQYSRIVRGLQAIRTSAFKRAILSPENADIRKLHVYYFNLLNDMLRE
jgi:hypothetical protein